VLHCLGWDSEESIKAYDQALKINPSFAPSLTGKGTILNDMGKYEEAISLFDKALKSDSSYSLASINKQFSLQAIAKMEREASQKEEQNRNILFIVIGIVVGGGIIGGLIFSSIYMAKANTVTVIPSTKPKTEPQQGYTDSETEDEWRGI